MLPFLTIQRQRCIKILCPKDPEFYTLLALNCEKGLHLLALEVYKISVSQRSASPKPHPSKPHPCNMPQAKTEVALQFLECCAAEVALQHWLFFCSVEVIKMTKSCAATSEKLHCNIEKAALQESGAFLHRFPAGFKPPRLGTHVSALLKQDAQPHSVNSALKVARKLKSRGASQAQNRTLSRDS